MKTRSTWQFGFMGFFWLLLCVKFFLMEDPNLLISVVLFLVAAGLIAAACYELMWKLGPEIKMAKNKMHAFYWILFVWSLLCMTSVFLLPDFGFVAGLYLAELIGLNVYLKKISE